MRLLTLILLVTGYVCLHSSARAQDNLTAYQSTALIDSLLKITDESIRDTSTINNLYTIAYDYRKLGNQTEARKYILKAFGIAKEIKWYKGMAKCYNVQAIVFLSESEYDSATYYFEKAIEVCKKKDIESLLAMIYMNYSNVFSEKGEYANATEYLIDALALSRKYNDQFRIGGCLTNLGVIYYYQGSYDSALSYYEQALDIFKELGDTKTQSFALVNIGSIKAQKGDFTSSLRYFKEAAVLKIKNQELEGLCIAYQNIAEISNHLSQFENDSIRKFPSIEEHADMESPKQSLRDSARIYLNKGIRIARKINSEVNIISSLSTLGTIYAIEGKSEKALKVYNEALKRAKAIDLRQNELDLYKHIEEVFSYSNRYDSALHYFKLYSQLKDTIFSAEQQKAIGKQEAKYLYEKEQALKDAEYKKQMALDQAEIKRQKLYQFLLGVIVVAVLILSLVIYRALHGSRRQRRAIEEQKHIIERKNLEILSSIRYASRIQSALLKEEKKITPDLPEHFVFFRPRDIVSGDFYWSVKQDHWWYLAVADCTGHGVPGGFLTMLGTAYLNEIISTSDHISPNDILDQLREKIVNQLSQSEDVEDSKDGMDISLIAVNLHTLEAEWAGAQNPIYIVGEQKGDENEVLSDGRMALREIKGDKQPIGYHSHQTPFRKHTFTIEKGESFYLFSDGFPDQFGGPKNKKYRYNQLKKFILSIADRSPQDQKEAFETEFDTWKGNQEQLDDVCVIGVKL